MGKKLAHLKELGLIDEEAEISNEYKVVIELLSDEELAVLEKMKEHFDAAAAVSGGKPARPPIVI
jgi:hypothetical protein